jgi:isocitrate dehydrogenase
MVNSDKGITNLHVPDVIVDASMPAMIRTSGQMYNKWGTARYDCTNSDRSYSGVYEATIEFCKKHGALTQEQWEVFQM